MSPPSTKNGRRSSSFTSNAVRLTIAGSSSTCPKSGFTVASSVRFELTPYFRSAPMPPKYELPPSKGLPGESGEIGRASCRERGEGAGGGGDSKKRGGV